MISILFKLLYLLGVGVGLSGTIIGILLPIIPHMPFLLLATFCLSRLSSRFNNWINQQLQRTWSQKHILPLLEKMRRWPLVGHLITVTNSKNK